MSEEMTMLPGRGIRVDLSQPHDQEITVDNHRQHIDELLELIKGANGMPVLVVTTSDGRLSAIAMNGLQNMVPTNGEVKRSTENKSKDFRAWMLLVASLMATAAFTAGLTPPGGFWADDKAPDKDGKDGHVAGTSVMLDKFPFRYHVFQGSNSITFFYSLLAIGLIAKNIDDKPVAQRTKRLIQFFAAQGVLLAFMLLGISYISGTWDDHERGVYNIASFVFVLFAVSTHWFITWFTSRRWDNQDPGMNSS
ncbi:unnamed protein product [Alopecurus aequalis]